MAWKRSRVQVSLGPPKDKVHFKLFDIQRRLEEKLGREVDLIPKDSIDKYIRDEVIAEGSKIYEHE